MTCLAIIGTGLVVVFASFLLHAASGVGGEKLAEEYLKKGNKAYIDGDYDRAIVYLAQAVALAPEKQEAVSRLKLVVEQKKTLENSASYKEFVRQMNESESEKTKKFMERMENAQEILQMENSRKMLELKLESERIITEAVARQDAVLEVQSKKVERMRVIIMISFLVGGIFVMLNIYLLVYIFRRPAEAGAGSEKVVAMDKRRQA